MRKFLSLLFTLLICMSLFTVPAYATEVSDSESLVLPELPDLLFDEPYPKDYRFDKIILKLGDSYYGFVFEFYASMDLITIYPTASGKLTFYSYFPTYIDSYLLVGDSWDLLDSGTAIATISVDAYDWEYKWTYDELLVYSTIDVVAYKTYSLTGGGAYHKILTSDGYNVVFTGGGSSSGGGTSGSWSDEDKGWLGSLLDKLLNGIISFFSGLLQGLVDSIKDYFDTQLSIIDKFVNLIVNLWNNFKDFTLDPINEFLNSIDTTAINLWLSFFELPMVSEFLLISVILGIFSGLMSFLKSR